MSGVSYEFNKYTDHDLTTLQKELINDIKKECDIVYSKFETYEDTSILLIVCEKYFFRNNSTAVLTIQLVDHGNEHHAIVVSTAGGNGIFNISYGAVSDFAYIIAKILIKQGYVKIKENK